jgi:hypothetical protein
MFENDTDASASTETITDSQVENNETTQEQSETPAEDPLAYEKGVKLSDKLEKNPNALNDVLDLDKIPKFKWKGKEYTAKDLEKGFMLEADYTKKTQKIAQTRKEFEESQKYNKNLRWDLQLVKEDPTLADNFKKLYPEEYHGYLDFILAQDTLKKENEAADPASQNGKTVTKAQPEAFKDPRVDEIYEHVQKQKLETTAVHVNATFDKMSAKFPDASEMEVIGKVQNLLALHKQNPTEYKKPDEKVIEDLFKQSQEDRLSFAKAYNTRLAKQQKEANAKGAGPGAGGGLPGSAPRVAKTLKEATAFALEDMNSSGL